MIKPIFQIVTNFARFYIWSLIYYKACILAFKMYPKAKTKKLSLFWHNCVVTEAAVMTVELSFKNKKEKK